MTTMTTYEAKEAQGELERAIFAKVEEFEMATGMFVREIKSRYGYDNGGRLSTIGISTIVEL